MKTTNCRALIKVIMAKIAFLREKNKTSCQMVTINPAVAADFA